MLLPMGFNVASESYKTIVRYEGDGDIFACLYTNSLVVSVFCRGFIHKKSGGF